MVDTIFTAHELKQELHDAGLSQLRLAALIQRSPTYVHQRVTGYRPFTPSEEATIRDALAHATQVAA